MKFADAGFSEEGAFRKEGERLTRVCGLEQTPCIHPACMTIEAIHELGPDAAQEHAGDWDATDFFLDDEAEARGEACFQDHSIEIACVIGYDDARSLRQQFGIQQSNSDERNGEEKACRDMSDVAPRRDIKWQQDERKGEQAQDDEDAYGVDTVDGMQDFATGALQGKGHWLAVWGRARLANNINPSVFCELVLFM